MCTLWIHGAHKVHIQPSSGLKEISPGTKKCVLYGIHGSHKVHIQPSSALKEISPDTKKSVLYGIQVQKNVYFMESMDPIKYIIFVPGLISLRPDDG
jgi:tRNA(Ile2) C34 agmatinyltransferase TiaS